MQNPFTPNMQVCVIFGNQDTRMWGQRSVLYLAEGQGHYIEAPKPQHKALWDVCWKASVGTTENAPKFNMESRDNLLEQKFLWQSTVAWYILLEKKQYC